jgi:hypothetical protein
MVSDRYPLGIPLRDTLHPSRRLLFTVHCSLFTGHCSPFTDPRSPFTQFTPY